MKCLSVLVMRVDYSKTVNNNNNNKYDHTGLVGASSAFFIWKWLHRAIASPLARSPSSPLTREDGLSRPPCRPRSSRPCSPCGRRLCPEGCASACLPGLRKASPQAWPRARQSLSSGLRTLHADPQNRPLTPLLCCAPQVSQAAADLLAYCEAHVREDPLIIPVPASENPFREKKFFCTIL